MELPAEQTQPLPRVTAEKTQPFSRVGAAAVSQQTTAGSAGTTPPTAVVGGGNCPACGAELAPDQRYCVECGQRRDPMRPPPFAAVGGQTQAGGTPTPGPKRSRISPNTTLVAGIGTLMLVSRAVNS